TSIGCGRGIDEMAFVGYHRSNLSVRAGVLVRGLGVVRIAETGVPGVKAADLVSDKCGVIPRRSPVDRLVYCGSHDGAAVIGHIDVASHPRRAGRGSETSRPVES